MPPVVFAELPLAATLVFAVFILAIGLLENDAYLVVYGAVAVVAAAFALRHVRRVRRR